MNSLRVTVPALVALTALVAPSSVLLGSGPAAAAAQHRSVEKATESVLVTGTGTAAGQPDTLVASFAVEADAPTVDTALDRATAAATRMRDALVRAGVAKADLQTSNLGISPKRDDDEKITGYTVQHGLSAKIRDLPRAGSVMSAAIAAGGDAARLNGVSFGIEKDAALLAEARKKAFADARGKAELYAREAGRPLGRVLKVSEASFGYPMAGGQDRMAAADALVPIEPGRQELAVTITVEWALDRGPTPRLG